MTINAELLLKGCSAKGGWNRAQMDLLGLDYPPVSWWHGKVLGRHISQEDADKFIALRGVSGRQPRTRKKVKAALKLQDKNPQGVKTFSGKLPTIFIHTAAVVNGTRGAWCFSLVGDNPPIIRSMASAETTCNRMALSAAIAALNSLEGPSNAEVWSDSKYLVNGMARGWVKRWQAAGWMDGETKRPNWDLWEILLERTQGHVINFLWARCGSKEGLTECDRFARQACNNGPYLTDLMFEKMKADKKAGL